MTEAEISDEFVLVPHRGGKIEFHYSNEDGGRQVSSSYTGDRPTPMSMFSVWALQNGHVVGTGAIGWQGPNVPRAPSSDSIEVIIASDRESMFGRQCPRCKLYFRTNSAPFLWRQSCPYCGIRTSTHNFTTLAQRRYVQHYIAELFDGLNSSASTKVINLDEIADAAAKGLPKPTFYYEGEKQQLKFKCTECGVLTDVLGHNAYCCCCATKNNVVLLSKTLATIKSQTTDHAKPSDLLKLAVSEFESCCRDYVEQLAQHVAMTPNRARRAKELRFHSVDRFSRELKEVFDIEPLEGLRQDDIEFARVRFFRRNLYEHRGGVVDQEYLELSEDQKRLGQALRETGSNVANLCDIIGKIAANIHKGFHLILPPEQKALEVLKRP